MGVTKQTEGNNKLLRGIFGLNGMFTGGWRKLDNENKNLYSLLNINEGKTREMYE
jgi:hypothetical protein